jgi:serine-type D-Ala-D-Ala carboxypeptidase (penicillin-binding protein 5/6)
VPGIRISRLRALIAGLLVVAAIAWAAAPAQGATRASVPGVSVKGGVLIDADTGATLWGVNANVPRPMGSIAKVMAALVVLQAGDLNREITITKGAVKYATFDWASSAGLIAGDKLTAQELLEAMLVQSGCDAAFALAWSYGPGRPAFIAKMNAEAARLGMTHTHFSWFDGMPYPTEYSTYSSPGDLVKLAQAAMKYPLFAQIVAQKQYYLPAGDGHHEYLWQQTNALIGTYSGATGIKTGDTDAAGNCLLFEAVRNGVTLIGAVLNAAPSQNPGSAIDVATRVLNWGFSR